MSEINDGTLAAFVDGELEPETMRDVEKLIAADAEAREKVRLLRLSPMLIRAAFRDPALESVSPSLMKAVEPRRVVAPRSWVRRWTGLAMAASLLLAAFLGGQQFGADRAGSGSATEQLMGEIAEYHVVYARESEHRVEVPSSRRNHIETWLGDRLHRKLQIPELATAGQIGRAHV